jgi:hypothetical protein
MPSGAVLRAKLRVRRRGVLDRESSKLVAERHSAVFFHEHPRGEALVERGQGIRCGLFEERELGMRRRDRDGVEQRARCGGEPRSAGEHGVAHRVGDLLSGGEHLGDEERIAAGPLVQGGAVDTVRLRDTRNPARGERCEPEPQT